MAVSFGFLKRRVSNEECVHVNGFFFYRGLIQEKFFDVISLYPILDFHTRLLS